MAILPPSVDYTDKDFDALRARLIALVKSVFPDWSDFSVASFGNVLLEMYAFVGDVVTFYLDAQARESRLVTATQRKNVIALARLLGYRLHGARAATADARGLADLDVVLDRTPYLDGSAVVSAANGPYVEEESLLGSGPNRHFLVLVDQNDRATVRFGNGTSGAPPSGTISASYKTGGGAAGNVEAGSLVVVEGVFNDVHGRPVQLSVTNPAPASGGSDRQSVASAKLLAPESLRTLTRTEPDVDVEKLEGGALWLYRARAYRTQLEDKTFKTQSEIAKHLGVTRARMTQIMTLLRLDEALQKEVLAGNYGYVADRTLRAIASLRSKAAQRRALVEHGASARPMDPSQKPKRFQQKSTLDASLRLVLYLNPQMFVDMRAMGERHRAEVDAYVCDLNARLHRKSNKATRESVYSDITGKLASRSMLSIYTVQIDEKDGDGHKHFVVSLALDEAAWNKRRSTDGFVLLVSHTDLPQSAAEMVALYRAKDAVEKDFQTIKSDLELRPVFHHTDPKVRAHVSLCMLALLLERTIERRLRKVGKTMTAPAAFEELAAGHLNIVATGPDESVAYVATEPSTEQRELLARLSLEHLVDQDKMAARIEPRPAA